MAVLAVALTAGWVVLLVATPVLPGWAGAAVYGVGSFICHQLPDRSFHLAGFQLPVCARCMGIYAGVSSGMAYAWMRANSGRPILAMTSRAARQTAIVAAMPTLLTVALETAGVWYSSNLTRALAGLPLGAVVAFVVMSALATINYDECVPRRPTVPKPPQRPI